MSRPVGQVRPLQALAGMAGAVALVAVIVAGAHALVPPATLEAPLGAAAQDPVVCPAAGAEQAPATVRAAGLVECPDAFDGREVVYTGEVVGAVLRREGRSWLQLNDDPYALELGPLPEHRTAVGGNSGIAVSIPTSAVDLIGVVGSFAAHGDVVRVRGVFHRSDPDDVGALAIRGDSVEVVRTGRRITRRVSPPRVVVAAVMAALAAVMTVARRRSQAE